MLDVKEAKVLGNKKCVQLFGKTFCDRYADSGGSAYEISDDKVRCSYGMNDNEPLAAGGHALTEEKYKYYLTLDVSRIDGEIVIVESHLPEKYITVQ